MKNDVNREIHALVIYDIQDDKRRGKFAKCMQGYGYRVQKSAFEVFLTPGIYKEMIQKLQRMIDQQEDNVRIYRIYANNEIVLMGNSHYVKHESTIII